MTVLNERPIFLNCYSRGGSNILWNVFLSHPEACSPILENGEIFSLRLRKTTREGLRAAMLSRQPRLFDQWLLRDRAPLPPAAERFVDEVLYSRKMTTLDDETMRFKSRTETYRDEEVTRARLVTKNNNGLLFLGPTWRAMYPGAHFVHLTRDPSALYESHLRRGLHRSLATFADFYSAIAERMLEEADSLADTTLIRFEDLVGSPIETARRLYEATGLDFAAVEALRFKCKPLLQADGTYGSRFQVGTHRWFDFAGAASYLDPEVNERQSTRLPDATLGALRERLGPLCERLDYDLS